MAACHISGHANSYGLGIRVAFYLQWYGMIITCWFLESDALNLKFLNGVTILATSIGVALDASVLQPAEIYVALLLVCGTLYFLVPVYLWRVLTCCHPWWDTERWNRIRMGWLFRTAMALTFGMLLGVQIWFWCTGVYARPAGTDSSCQQYGFFFGQMPLAGPALPAINIILHLAMLVMGIWLFCDWIGMFNECRWWRRRKKRRWSITQDRVDSLQQLRTISDAITAAILITAIELAITWNHISDVNNLDSAAQFLPLAISAAYFLRSICIGMCGPPPAAADDDNDSHHYADFPFFPTTGGDYDGGGGGSYTVSDVAAAAGGPTTSQRRRAAYMGGADDWAYHSSSRRHHNHHKSHAHHHNHRRHRRGAQQMGFAASGAGEPVMSTAYSRRATVVDAPGEGGQDAAAAATPVQPEAVHENA